MGTLDNHQRDTIITADALTPAHVGNKVILVVPVIRDHYASRYTTPDRVSVTEGKLMSFRVEDKTITVTIGDENDIIALRHDHLIWIAPSKDLARLVHLWQDPNRR